MSTCAIIATLWLAMSALMWFGGGHDRNLAWIAPLVVVLGMLVVAWRAMR